MSLYDKIINAYPDLTDAHFGDNGQIELRDDADGKGEYIAKWNYEKPIPDGLKLGK